MKTFEMRAALSDAYMSQNWRDKVAKMSDSQVFVLYTKFKLSGRIK